MSQHDYVIANDSGASVRADLNSLFQAILSQNSGTSAPSSTSAGTMWLDTTGGAPYTLKIRDAGNNHWLTIASITDPGSDGNLAVSAIEGTNVLSTGESGGSKFLREDGDGSCSWQTAGRVLQVVQTVKQDSFVAAGNTNEQLITGYNCSITPSATNSKILVQYNFDSCASTANTARSYIERDIAGAGYAKLTGAMGTDPGGSLGDPSLSHAGTSDNWLLQRQAGCYLDSPSYSAGNAVTYRIGVQGEVSSVPVYIGKTQRDNSQYHPRTTSVLTLMEIAG